MKNPVTTITGILLLIVSVVTGFGLINSDQSVELQKLIPPIVEAVAGIVAIFKAGDQGGL